MSVKPRRDRRITTLHGALRQLSRHCRVYGDELQQALARNDREWLATEFRSRAVQLLMDIEALAALAAEEPEPPYAVYAVMRTSVEFMAGLCVVAGRPELKPGFLKLLADCPISL